MVSSEDRFDESCTTRLEDRFDNHPGFDLVRDTSHRRADLEQKMFVR
jgi:hypothetical protein